MDITITHLDSGSPRLACEITGGAIHVVYAVVDLKVGQLATQRLNALLHNDTEDKCMVTILPLYYNIITLYTAFALAIA